WCSLLPARLSAHTSARPRSASPSHPRYEATSRRTAGSEAYVRGSWPRARTAVPCRHLATGADPRGRYATRRSPPRDDVLRVTTTQNHRGAPIDRSAHGAPLTRPILELSLTPRPPARRHRGITGRRHRRRRGTTDDHSQEGQRGHHTTKIPPGHCCSSIRVGLQLLARIMATTGHRSQGHPTIGRAQIHLLRRSLHGGWSERRNKHHESDQEPSVRYRAYAPVVKKLGSVSRNAASATTAAASSARLPPPGAAASSRLSCSRISAAISRDTRPPPCDGVPLRIHRHTWYRAISAVAASPIRPKIAAAPVPRNHESMYRSAT